MLNNLISLLNVYYLVSGMKIKKSKSVLLGINMEIEQVANLANSIGCSMGNWPIKYLGVPLGGNPWRIDFWDLVVTKISKRLDGWKKGYVSKGGRLTLIHSMLSTIPTYFLSLFCIPKDVAIKIEKTMSRFLWESKDNYGGDHLIS